LSYALPAAGDLRESILIQTETKAPDGRGGSTSTWSQKIAAMPARITPMMRGGETVIAAALTSVATYEIWVRCNSDTDTIAPADRVVNARTGLTYNIRLISNPDEHRRFYCILCQTGTAQ
jgi:SPP1 family predicted phage head-tail adaptor